MKYFLPILLGIFFLTFFNSYSQEYNKYLVAYYSFDDSDCKDYSGNNYNGTPVNNPTFIDNGVLGKAIHFEGKGWYIPEGTDISNIGSHVLLPKIEFSKYNEFTISLWVRFQDFSHWPSGDAYIFFGHHNYGWLGVFNHIFEYKMNGKLINSFSVGGLLWENVIQNDFQDSYKNNWVHYALTFSKNTVKGYINGKLIGQLNQSVNIVGNTAALARHWWLYDGEERTSARFTGDMDEVKIFGKALTDDEINEIATNCEKPVAKILSTGNNLCEGDAVQLSLDKTFNNILWSTGETSKEINVTKTGQYIATYFDNEKCKGSDTIVINFIPKPNSSFESLNKYDYCDGESVLIKVKDIFDNYEWSTGEKTQSINVTKSDIYKVKYWNKIGCESEDSVRINFYPIPSSKILKSSEKIPCIGDEIKLFLDKKYSNIVWSDGQTSDTLIIRNSGQYSVTYWNNSSCIGNDTIQIQFLEKPEAHIIKSNYFAVCEGDSLILSLDKTYPNTQWSNGESQNSITVSKSGFYKVSFWNSPNCIGEDSIEVIFNDNARNVIKVNPTNYPCEGDSVILSTEFDYQNILWSTGETTRSILVKKSGIYKVISWNNDNNCKGTDSIEITFTPKPSAQITTFPKIVPCEGDTLILTLSKKFDNILWSTGETSISTVVQRSGKYSCTYWDNGSCSATTSIDIALQPLPTSEIVKNKNAYCIGDTAVLTLKDAYPNIYWSTGETTQSIVVTQSGDYSVSFWNSDKCIGNLSFNILFEQLPIPEIKIKLNDPCTSNPIELKTNDMFSDYKWFEVGTNNPIYNSNPAFIKKSGKYFVKVKNSNGCEGISEIVDLVYESNTLPKFNLNLGSNNSVLNFDSVGFSVLKCKNIIINNLTNSGLTIKNPQLKFNWDFAIPQGQLPLQIPALGSGNLLVCVSPTSFGKLSDTILFNDGCFNYTVPIRAVGIPNIYTAGDTNDTLIIGKTTEVVGQYFKVSLEYIQTSNKINVLIQTNISSQTNLNIYIYDYLGQLIRQENQPVSFNSSKGKYRSGKISLNAENLNSAMYFIVAEYSGTIYCGKIIINK